MGSGAVADRWFSHVVHIHLWFVIGQFNSMVVDMHGCVCVALVIMFTIVRCHRGWYFSWRGLGVFLDIPCLLFCFPFLLFT
jgi:hypothetical protein